MAHRHPGNPFNSSFSASINSFKGIFVYTLFMLHNSHYNVYSRTSLKRLAAGKNASGRLKEVGRLK